MKQTRFIPIETCGLQVREPQEGQTESRTIDGTPIVFGVRSVNLTPWSESREVYEVLERGCISQDLISRSDVILNLNHSNMVPDVLGRCRNGKGTLSLALREDKVECSCDLPNTNNANDALELMHRGDITGMSFAFEDDCEDTENGVSYERTGEIHDGKEVWLRHVKRITGLYDVAIVTHPAYEQTSVGTREVSDRIDAAIEAHLKREAENQPEDEKPEETGEEQRACGGDKPKENECGGGDKSENRDDDPEDKPENDPENDDQEQREREIVAVMRMRRNRVRLAGRELDNIIY
ncbi:MAG: HK97 family phage prohead protease [Prevotella sp.]|nr:HK97 family phage prohead protease [Prevotella sp.]